MIKNCKIIYIYIFVLGNYIFLFHILIESPFSINIKKYRSFRQNLPKSISFIELQRIPRNLIDLLNLGGGESTSTTVGHLLDSSFLLKKIQVLELGTINSSKYIYIFISKCRSQKIKRWKLTISTTKDLRSS